MKTIFILILFLSQFSFSQEMSTEAKRHIWQNIDPILLMSMGLVPGIAPVNKYGHAEFGIQTAGTDVWDRADADATQDTWLAPTAARIHELVSDSTEDGEDSVATGMRTLRLYGLRNWDSKETSEIIVLNGDTAVQTVNDYVIIHRLEGLTWGSTGPNYGTITCMALVDSTITAQINPGQGQTQMAIYGIPSTQTMYINNIATSIQKATATSFIRFTMLVNPIPDVITTAFIKKTTFGVVNTGTSDVDRVYKPYKRVEGPAIIKIRGFSSANDLDASAEFDAYLIDN